MLTLTSKKKDYKDGNAADSFRTPINMIIASALLVVGIMFATWIIAFKEDMNISNTLAPSAKVTVLGGKLGAPAPAFVHVESAGVELPKKHDKDLMGPGRPNRDMNKRDSPSKHSLYVIFSTDCGEFQDWQTLLLFHSATVVKQEGMLVRIATGCDEDKKFYLNGLYKKLFPQYGVHFTPAFEMNYVYNNKPRGLQHWLKYSNPPVENDAVIALLDPDMIFVRRLSATMKGQPKLLYGRYMTEKDVIEKVVPGMPVGQTYGLGAPWTIDTHEKFNRSYVCGAGSPCLQVKQLFGQRHFAVGPPYIVHKADMIKIADTWSEYVPKVRREYPFLLAEMYAYSMAAAHLNLPHQQFEHLMVSNTESGGEGWAHVDALVDACIPPDDNGIYFAENPLPTVIHYCQHFRTGEFAFGKRAANKQMFACDAPLFKEPPSDLSQVTYYWDKGQVRLLSDDQDLFNQ